MYNEEVELPKDYNKVLCSKNNYSQHVFLTKCEINKILNYEPESNAEHCIKNQFIIGCLTGARHSDYIHFNESNVYNDILIYISKKTHIKSEIPISDALIYILKDTDTNGYNGKNYTLVYFNLIIKDICRKCGIDNIINIYNRGKFQQNKKYNFITSHTARRSFATNLYKCGVDIYAISKFF